MVPILGENPNAEAVGWTRGAEPSVLSEESGIPTPRLALPVGLALGPAREKLAPEEPPEKRAVLMGPMDPPRPGFLPRGKIPLRGEEGFISEGALGLCTEEE